MKVSIEIRDFRGLIKRQIIEDLDYGDEITIYLKERPT